MLPISRPPLDVKDVDTNIADQPHDLCDDIVEDDHIIRRWSRIAEQMQSYPKGGISSSETDTLVTMSSQPTSKYFQDLLRDPSVYLTITWDDASSP